MPSLTRIVLAACALALPLMSHALPQPTELANSVFTVSVAQESHVIPNSNKFKNNVHVRAMRNGNVIFTKDYEHTSLAMFVDKGPECDNGVCLDFEWEKGSGANHARVTLKYPGLIQRSNTAEISMEADKLTQVRLY
ncbi:hypothetical protein THASP1DRAFT_23343 [Thamnocephalis sphaerospora]|uniref:Uncharacterized protein n=1 Tax=Thamnocephalis sphaerospora TaxID=78915 RepID=A0A4P9XRK9_9FUNG|nr:hypothetical protein THASP1DRAFT_23343 [Thamnocephalis sphaerospora]|eukprot:RKP08724.1 hypothetical protein THASP1DRAFT_23343 [Thamnocephalis sphaerospora]